MATRDQVGLDRQLSRLQPQILQPPDLGARERLVGYVGQRAAAPQRERRPCFAVRCPVGMLGRGDQPLEPGRIDAIDHEPQLVAATAREDLPRAPAQQPAQLRHIQLHHLGSRGRGVLAPQSLAEPIGRDGLVDLQRQHRQNRALLWRAEHYLPAVKARLDRPEKTDVHITRRQNDPIRARAADQSAPLTAHIPASATVPSVRSTRRHRRSQCASFTRFIRSVAPASHTHAEGKSPSAASTIGGSRTHRHTRGLGRCDSRAGDGD